MAQICDGVRLIAARTSHSGPARQVTQSDFAAAYAVLVTSNLPVTPNRAEAWVDFAHWRARYEGPLDTLAHLTRSPLPAWPDDRAAIAPSADLEGIG